MSTDKKKSALSPCTIIESYDKAIRDVAGRDSAKAKLLKRFVTSMQPEQCEVPLSEAKKVFLMIERHLGNDIQLAARLIDELIGHVRSRNPAALFETPTRRQLTDYGLFAAFRAIAGVKHPKYLSEKIQTIEPERVPALVWLYQLVITTEFEFHLIDPDRYYDHTKVIRQAVTGLWAEPSIRPILRQANTFSEGLNTLDLTIGAAARSKDDKLVFSPHAAIHEDLPSKFDYAQKLNTGTIALGERLKETSTRSQPSRETSEKLSEYHNATKANVLKAIKRELSEPREEGAVAARRVETRADSINDQAEQQLHNLVEELSNGEVDNPLITKLRLKKLCGAEKHVIFGRLVDMTEAAGRQAIATPARNAVYTLCELMDYWQAIYSVSEDKRLSAYLTLLLITHIDERRARSLKAGDSPTDSSEKTIYLTPQNSLKYQMIGGQISGDPNLVVELALSPTLAKRLAAYLKSGVEAFADVALLYSEAKNKLRRTHPGIPRNLSQWSYGAREVLGALLTDQELEIVSGTLNHRSKLSSAYIQMQLTTLNERVFNAYEHFCGRLSSESRNQLGWLTRCMQRPELLPSARIGSTKPDQQPAALEFIERLYTQLSTVRAHIKTLRSIGRIDTQTLVDEINLLCINYWLLTQWLTTGRGHIERMSIIDAQQFLVVEDKDTSVARVPRICGYSDQKYSWLNAWRNQYAIITKALRNLEGVGIPLPVNLEAFFKESNLIPFSVVNTGSQAAPVLELARLTRSRLDTLCPTLGLPEPAFPSNLPRHLWWSQMLTDCHPALIRLQLGQQHNGPGMLDKSSSVSAPILPREMVHLTLMIDELALQVKTAGANAVPQKETAQ